LRAKNLASLHLGRHIVRTRPGGARHIVIASEEVKNQTPLAFEVSGRLGKLIDAYLARCRPLLSGDPDGFLFPARKGGAKTPAQLAAQIKHAIAQATGIVLNAHAFRHLSAMCQDWMADAVLRNRSPVVQFPANREKNRDSSRKRPFPPETGLESTIRFNELRRNSLRFVTGK
jgi:hypothetical protein